MITDEDRKVLSRLLAKCIANFNCGKAHEAAMYRSALDAHLHLCGVEKGSQLLARQTALAATRGPRNNCGEGA